MSKRIILLQALASTPRDLALILKGVDLPALTKRPVPDQWSMADVLAHLSDVEVQYLARLKRVVVEERPFLPRILPDESKHDIQTSLEELLARFEAARAETVDFLKDISPGGWQRPAVHETRGETKLRFLVQDLVNHDIGHLNQVVEVQQRLRVLPALDPQPVIIKKTQIN